MRSAGSGEQIRGRLGFAGSLDTSPVFCSTPGGDPLSPHFAQERQGRVSPGEEPGRATSVA